MFEDDILEGHQIEDAEMHKSVSLEQPMVISRQGPRKNRIIKNKIDELQTEQPIFNKEPSEELEATVVQQQKNQMETSKKQNLKNFGISSVPKKTKVLNFNPD